jgi:Sulfotransferase domain
MQVIGAGLGGTGTLQIKGALEMLGLAPCYHIAEVERRPEHVALWRQVADGASPAWDAIFGEYESCVDFPACVLYRELLDAYPDARVVLTVRDPERAYDRVRDTIYGLTTREDSPLPAELRDAFGRLVWDRVFNGSFENRDDAVEVYRRWNDKVRSQVPSDRLLVYDVDAGWEPLCRFFGLDVPTEPFPG